MGTTQDAFRIMAWRGQAQEERFWSMVDKAGDQNGCWMFKGRLAHHGYGRIYFTVAGQTKEHMAHRVSLYLHGIPVPRGMETLHSCDTRARVNPSHLSVGTRAQNMQDMLRKGRARWDAPKGERSGHAKMTEESVREARMLRASGLSVRVLADKYGVHPQTVRNLISRKTWFIVP